jgi:YVTN family beta-propeller protein
VGVTTTEGLVDMVSDAARHMLYIANSGLNRVEIFDTQAKQFLSPIKVGQLPRSLALSPDGGTLYVANTGGESISVIDLNQLAVVDKMSFPPIPFNASFAISTPRMVVATRSGLEAIMSDGTNNSLWKSIGNQMTPRGVSPVIGTTTAGLPANITTPYSLAATPEGSYAILMDGSGNAYLYDASTDQYVTKQQIFTAPIQGYYGPIGAGPNGQYYLVNGTVLNAGLTPVAGPSVTVTARPVSAVVPVNANTFARFVQPVLTGVVGPIMVELPI